MVVPRDTINGIKAALSIISDIQLTIYNYTTKQKISPADIKKIGSDKLSEDVFGFIQKIKNVVKHLEPVIPHIESNNEEFQAMKTENDKLSEYSRIVDKIDEHMTDWRNTMDIPAPRTRNMTVADDNETTETSQQLFYIGSRPTGTCSQI